MTPQNRAPGSNFHPPLAEPAAVIRPVALPGTRGRSRFALVFLLAWLASAVIHAILIFLFLFVTVPVSNANVAMETQFINTQIDDEKPPEANLENDLGIDPNDLLNYSNKIIKDVSVPGPATTEATGIESALVAPPVDVAPPPGIFNTNGLSSGALSPKIGAASPNDFPGGLAGINVPGGFAGRSGSTRADLLRLGGGNGETEAAVARGQIWLVQHQARDGHWSLDAYDQHGSCNCQGFGINNDIAATAFGLLPLLGAGETHKNPKCLYRTNVDRALKFLMSKQSPEGAFGGGMYAHGLATIAICEAYGMTADPALKRSAQRAIDFIRFAQSDSGGWRYEPRQGGDTSVAGWQVMALKSGQMAGLLVDDKSNPTLARSARWLDLCMTPDEGGYRYMPNDEPTPTMTAVGLLCRLYLGTTTRNRGIRTGVSRLKQTPPPTVPSLYYYYYSTQVMHHVGGADWEFWNSRMKPMLLNRQDQGNDPKHRHQKGSWSPASDVHGGAGGRLMTTSLAILTLEVYYRHLPLYRRDTAGGKVAVN
jgi:hypothetical protein